MVIITGLAMISFVLFGAVDDPRNMPTTLVAIFLAAIVGGGFWVAGLGNGKSAEWGVTGAILGALMGIALAVYTREQPAAVLTGGNLSRQEMTSLQMQRNLATQFMQQALVRTKSPQAQFFQGFQLLPDPARDVVFSEILSREADRLGIALPEGAVVEYINDQTNKKMTKELFSEIRETLRTTDNAIMSALRRELRAQTAANVMYGSKFVTPATYYDFFRKLNAKQSAELVSIPVSSFEEGLPEPTEGELRALFDQYRNNFPNVGDDGRLEEGRPGFRQPQRVGLAYFEIAFEDVKATVGEVTDEEIQKVYDERYKKELPVMDLEGALDKPLDGPDLPKLTPPAVDDKPAAPATEDKPAAPAAEDKPAAEKPAETPAAEEKPATEDKPESEAKPESATETPEETSALKLGEMSFVALFDDAPAAQDDAKPAADTPAEAAKPAAETPADEKPEAAKPTEEKPADEKPAAETPAKEGNSADAKPPEGDKPTEKKPAGEAMVPPAPTSDVRPLDDELKAEIREDILRERTHAKMRELGQATLKFMNDKGFQHSLDKESEDYLSAEELNALMEGYAEKNGMTYVQTPLLSAEELREGEDYPIGLAFSMEGQPMLVAERVFRMGPNELYRAMSGHNFRTDSEFVFWKTADKAPHAPESMDDEIVKKQVIAAWKRQQALPKAESRAEELLALAKGSDKPMSELFAEETVTGDKDSLYLTVKETGPFSWMQRSTAQSPNPFQPAPIRLSQITGAEDAGERFMEEVCNEMQVGDTAIIPNQDGSALYLVRLTSRDPDATPEAMEEFRKEFIAAGNLPEYRQLAQAEVALHSSQFYDWAEEVWDQYAVEMPERQ